MRQWEAVRQCVWVCVRERDSETVRQWEAVKQCVWVWVRERVRGFGGRREGLPLSREFGTCKTVKARF